LSGQTKVKLATAWLDGCSGCHMSLLDVDELLVALVERVELVYGPLVDAPEYPDAVDVALVEGAVSSVGDQKLAQTIRAKTKILISLGDCAVTSNVPSMRNTIPVKKLLERLYIEGADAAQSIPTDGVPALLRHAVPLAEVVKVDIHIPGCPPAPGVIAHVLTSLLDGKKPELAGLVKFG
jgi:NAD-reducing hydrogenase small subunit